MLENNWYFCCRVAYIGCVTCLGNVDTQVSISTSKAMVISSLASCHRLPNEKCHTLFLFD